MKRTICLVLGLSFISAVALADDKKTDELTDPLEILKKVDAAAKAVKTVKYDLVFEADGAMAQRSPKLTCTVLMSGFVSGAPEKYVIDAAVSMPDSAEPRKISCGTDNDMFFLVDHAAKKAYEDIDPAVMGAAGGFLMRGTMIEFVYDTPFSDEINGRSQKLTGSKTLDGHDCYEVHVVYAAERAPEATWYFSKKDFLPRGRIDHYTLPNNETGTTTKMVTRLVVDPKLDEDAFKLKLPEGYTKTDDFAPELFPRR